MNIGAKPKTGLKAAHTMLTRGKVRCGVFEGDLGKRFSFNEIEDNSGSPGSI